MSDKFKDRMKQHKNITKQSNLPNLMSDYVRAKYLQDLLIDRAREQGEELQPSHCGMHKLKVQNKYYQSPKTVENE